MIPTRLLRPPLIRRVLAVLVVTAPALAMLGFAPTAAAAQPPPPQTITVPIRNFTFTPADLTVHVGDTVTWVNEDRAPHDVTTTSAPASFASDTLMQGQSYSHTFDAPGAYSYQCTIHSEMVATITAVEHEAAAPAPPPAEAVPPAPEVAAEGAPADGAPVAGAPADGAAAPSPGTPPAGAPAAAAPAPGTASGTLPAPGTTQVVGAAQPVRQLDPLLIVAGFALGLTTLCLLLISAAPAGAPAAVASGTVAGSGAGAGGPIRTRATATTTPTSVFRLDRGPVTLLVLRVLAAVGFIIDAYVHFDLAADYDVVGSTITQGALFRLQGVVAALAALLIFMVHRTWAYQVVFLIGISALAPVVLYTYVDVGALGPLPNMYEPVWYADKTISAIGEAVAAAAAVGLFLLTMRSRNPSPAPSTRS